MVEKVSATAHAAYERIHATEEFAELKRRYLGFVVPMTVSFMVWYLLYVVASNWATDFMGTEVFGNINVALIWGLLQFVTTFGIAVAYSRYSNEKLDPLSDKLKADFEAEIKRGNA